MKISFGKIDHVVVIGGSWVAAEFLKILSKSKFSFSLISSERHMNDIVDSNGLTLREFSSLNNIKFHLSSDINNDNYLQRFIKKNTLAVAMGAPWVFDKKIVKFFDNKIVDFMGIDLPRYRGGAHYTWQILSRNKKGACNLQMVLGGTQEFHKGPIIKSGYYKYPKTCDTPEEYFKFAVKKEGNFLRSFLKEVKKGKIFNKTKLIENESTYYPFLNTLKHGWINWNWEGEEIFRFINSFGDPYEGASTYLNKKRVFIKKIKLIKNEEDFHPFHSGIVYRKNPKQIFVACVKNSLMIESIFSSNQKSIIKSISEGDRFYTPTKKLEDALSFKAYYNNKGLKENE